MKKIGLNWSWVKIIRFTLGLIIVGQGIITNQYAYSLIGVMISIIALANIDCCGTSGCTTNFTKENTTNIKSNKIKYEEVL